MLRHIIGQNDPVNLCYFLYENRKLAWMAELKSLASTDEQGLGVNDKRSPFYLVRHHIGRLCHHIRAPRELIRDSRHMEQILQTYAVEIVGPLPGVQMPLRDNQTNLKGILNRMFKKDNVEEKKLVEEGLINLNKVSGIFDEFVDCYEQPGVDLDVHAEIKVLEHFYRSKLHFVGNDPFIACSKPACLCCELYFRHFPARIVIPSSHRKVWTKWRPPKVNYGTTLSDQAKEQREILSKITDDLREGVINQVLQRTRHSHWHPDSRTYITDSQYINHQPGSTESDSSEMSESEYDLDSSDGAESETWSDFEDGGISILSLGS